MKYKVCIVVVIAGSFLVMNSCKSEYPSDSMTTVELHSRVYPEGEKATAALLFWDEYTFKNSWLKGEDAFLMHGPVLLQNDIDYYRYENGRTLTVGMEYPDEEYVYATGYAPYDALEISDDYKTLTVKEEYKNGKTDFMCCDGNENHKGSVSDLFINEEHELKFRHMIPKIRFVGIRDQMMYGVISVNNVKVNVYADNNLLIPQSFVFRSNYTDKQTYVASAGQMQPIAEPLILEQDTKDYIPANADGLSLMSCYVFVGNLPDEYDPFADSAPEGNGEVKLRLDISADYSWYSADGVPVLFETPEWKNKEVIITLNHAGECFYPGYEYVVYITFKRETVMLQGFQQNWEDGGIHYLPVSPAENNN